MKSEYTRDLRTEQRIAEFEQQYESGRVSRIYEEITAGIPHGFAILRDGKIALANRAFAELAGIAAAELIGTDIERILEMVHRDDRSLLNSLLRSAPGYAPSCFAARSKGEISYERWLEFNTNQITFLGKPAIVTSVIDATERMYIEQVGRESEQRFRSVAETAADGIIIADAEGQIEYWNRAASEIFGYEPHDVIGKPISMLVPERMHATFLGVWEKLLLTKASRHAGMTTDMRAVRSDGSEFPVEISHATWESGERRSFSVTIRDVSEVRSAQRRMEVQSRLAAMGQLTSGIAHDFNNILGTIILQCEMLLSGQHLSAKDRERLAVILEQSRRAATLTSQMMDFSNRTIVDLKPLDMALIAQTMKMHLEQILPDNIAISTVLDEARYIAMGDPARLKQVFTNLGLNSRDAMPDGGTLVIGLSRQTVRLGETRPFRDMGPGEWIRISVSDSGSGIKPEDLPRVFEPFFTTKPPGKGSGLGLAQVYGIIKQHEGFIDVHSRPGQGAVFTIYLPSAMPLRGEVHPFGETHAEGQAAEAILVVEEDESTRSAIREILSALNYEVLLASDAMQAMALLKQMQGAIDLVLVDKNIPQLSTFDFGARLRALGFQCPVVVMTGSPLGRDEREKLIEENLDWIRKPFSSEALARKVRQVLAQI